MSLLCFFLVVGFDVSLTEGPFFIHLFSLVFFAVSGMKLMLSTDSGESEIKTSVVSAKRQI